MIERCSLAEDRDSQLEDLKQKFEERNYPIEVIEKQFGRARSKNRKDLISQNRKKLKYTEQLFSQKGVKVPPVLFRLEFKR